MTEKKTLAMKLLEGKQIDFQAISYPFDIRDAEEVARAINIPAYQVYKTLVVARTPPAKNILAMVASGSQLDLKKLARAVSEKKVKMARQQDAEALTGLQVGGISALALVNRGFQVFLDSSAKNLSQIVVSAGERGSQIQLAVDDLVKITGARFADIAAPEAREEV